MRKVEWPLGPNIQAAGPDSASSRGWGPGFERIAVASAFSEAEYPSLGVYFSIFVSFLGTFSRFSGRGQKKVA